jgi:type IV pilus biogenesis protein CpaD/CtpE
MRSSLRVFLTLFLIVALSAGCSTQKTVTTREVHYDPRTGEPVRIEKETTTTESSGTGASILSGTISVVGEILAVPVRLVGVLVRAIL